MNKIKRTKLNAANEYLSSAINMINFVKTDEEDCIGNMPENLEGSVRYEAMENAVDALDNAISTIEEAIDLVNEAKGGV